jgi:putative ABC transport system permease protein
MLLNFLKLSFRNLLRQKFSSFVNIFGLALGFASFIIIGLYVYDEQQYDQFHTRGERIFRISHNTFNPERVLAQLPALFYDPIKRELPEIEHIARINVPHQPMEIKHQEKSFLESGIIFADTAFFDIFSFATETDNLEDFRKNPRAALVTRKTAQKYFGDEDPIGKLLTYNNQADMEITGILEDVPRRSHLQFDIVVNYEMLKTVNPFAFAVWGNFSANYYVLLKEGADPQNVADKLLPLFGAEQKREYDAEVYFMQLQNLKDIYSGSGGIDTNIKVAAGSQSGQMIFSISAVLLLLLACFNYVNLASAKSTSRAREVGMRKVLGSGQGQLIRLFLAESFLISLIAMILAIGIVEFTIPYFSDLSGKELSFEMLPLSLRFISITALLILVSLLAGLYPAFVMSRFSPAAVLKGTPMLISQQIKGKFAPNLRFRQALIVLQFAVSIGLVCGSIILYQQTHFALKQSGFVKESLIVLQNNNQRTNDFYHAFKNQLTQYPFITAISAGEHVPSNSIGNQGGLKQPHQPDEERAHIFFATVDYGFFETLGATMAWGRTFDPQLATDTITSVILNQSAAKLLKILPEDENPMLSGFWDGNEKRVIGVVEDILFESAHRQVRPTAFFISYINNYYRTASTQILIRFNSKNLTEVVDAIETTWQQHAGDEARLEYFFMDSRYENMYRKELQIASVARVFTFLALILACLGLLGTTVYLMESRKKELGVRKVLGASALHLSAMISKSLCF